MQALMRLCLPLLMALPVQAQEDWARVDLGEFMVPAACPGVSMRSLPQQQQQQKMQQQSVASWESGRVALSLRAWPERRLRDRQSIKTFQACAQASKSRVPAAQLIGAERVAEDALKAAINQCLAERQQSFTARTVVLSRGPLRCG